MSSNASDSSDSSNASPTSSDYSELAALAARCDALDEELAMLSPEERRKRIAANLGVSADVSDEQIDQAVQEMVLSDPFLPEWPEALAQEVSMLDSLFSLPKERLDQAFVGFLTTVLEKYDDLDPVERRTEILSWYLLSSAASDADLEAAVRKEISEGFAEPIPADLVQQCVDLCLTKARVPATPAASGSQF